MAGAFVLFSISLGVTEGSYSQMINLYTRNHTGHIQIHKKGYLERPSIYKNFSDFEDAGQRILSLPEVRAWTPRLYIPALAFAGSKTTGVRISGIDPVREAATTAIKEKIRRGRYLRESPSMDIIITQGLSRVLGVDVSDEIALISQGADGAISNDLFTVAGILEGEDRAGCYIHIKTAQDFIVLPGRIHEIAVILDRHSQAEKTAAAIEKIIRRDDLAVAPWQVVEKHFYRAMQMDKQGNWITQFIIMFIVAIGVLNTVLMTLLERTREFGILRAVGTRPYQIFTLVVLETALLSFISIIFGALLSLLCNYVLKVYGITLPTPIELEGLRFESYVSEITAETIILPALTTLFVALSVSILPAIRAARITPVRALRAD